MFPKPVAAYGASKAALNYLTKKIHQEYSKEGLIAFALSPGWAQTDMGNSGAKRSGIEQAPLSVADSVAGQLKIIDEATQEHGGRFWSYDGQELAW